MKLLMLGGSFNPPHIGHLLLAEELAFEFGYDRVALVPAFLPPHKALNADPGAEARLAMTEAAVAGDPLFMVDDCELRRGGVSYTVDTLDYLVSRYAPSGKPGLAIGDDLAPGFPSWKDNERILSIADLIVARRVLDPPGDLPFACRLARNSLVEVSSTLVRSRLAAGGPWRRLVPEGVARYIEDHGLYSRA